MKKRILWCSDNTDLPTGYSNQTIYILRALAQTGRFDLSLLAHQYGGNERQAVGMQGVEPYVMFPGNYEGGTISYYVKRWQPNLVAWLCDAFMVPWIPQKMKEWGPNHPKTLFYVPLDSEDIYVGMEETLSAIDYLVTFGWFGHNFIKKHTGLDSFVIPHCTDPSIFYPYPEPDRERIKKENGLEGKFVIGMIGRNQSRKNPQRLLYILKRFFDEHKDAYAFFHCDPFDPMQVSGGKTNMLIHAKELGLIDHIPVRHDCPNCRLRFTGTPFFSGIPQQQLNAIYNMMDVHCMTTTGEGFGITTIEAMAARIPNIQTDYTMAKELLVDNGRCGEPVKWNTFINGGYNTKRVLPDEDDFVAKLEKLYNKPELRQQYGQVGREKVMRMYSTQAVLPQWQQLIGEIMEDDLKCVV